MSTLRLTTIANQGNTASVPSETVINGSAKAWVNFNGTGTVAIRASFNVTSITDNGTGDYTVNFTNAMTDANYAGVVTQSGENTTTSIPVVHQFGITGSSTSSGFRFKISEASAYAATRDAVNVYVAIFR